MTAAVRRRGLAWMRALMLVAATGAATPGHMMDRMWGVAWGWALLWLLFGVALIVLVVLAIVWLIRSMRAGGTRPTGGASPASARDALDLRYARGEISREEYLQARRDLEGPSG